MARSAAGPTPTPDPSLVPASLTGPTAKAVAPMGPPVAVIPTDDGADARPASPSLDDYRRRVWTHLATHAPSAPPGTGSARVMFGLDETGGVLFVRLARSSGRPAFDRACLASVRAAAPLPSPPAGTARADLVFEVPIEAARAQGARGR
ncbi:energy transducer TonB [Phenylobacterium sp.]|uniref:energy transducer TonB family protein n=2 Tax=Phenylobacterium sp. TaxID=1871053 RepID=UPI0035B0D6D5